jgi:hypothetical protein
LHVNGRHGGHHLSSQGASAAELVRLVRDLRRARRSFIDATLRLGAAKLECVLDDSGWTARRLIEYCRATERLHFSRMYHFFDEDAKVYDSRAASLDHIAPQDTEKPLADECSAVWLAGRETEMWIDVIEDKNLDEARPGSPEWPQGGWSIRGVFEKITRLYREKARTLASL